MGVGGFQTTWVDCHWSPHRGCPGCRDLGDNCAARQDLIRKGKDPNQIVKSLPEEWNRPYKFERGAWVLASPDAEFFADGAAAWIPNALDLMRELWWLQWIILTKRVDNAMKYLPRDPIPNLWVGTSAGTQRSLVERVPMLYELPVAGCVLSLQPVVEPLEISKYLIKPNLQLVVVGCEMGKNPRFCDIEWLKDIRAACDCYGVTSFLTRYRTPSGILVTPETYNHRRSNERSRPSWNGGVHPGPQH